MQKDCRRKVVKKRCRRTSLRFGRKGARKRAGEAGVGGITAGFGVIGKDGEERCAGSGIGFDWALGGSGRAERNVREKNKRAIG
jgi:hypothetical protein